MSMKFDISDWKFEITWSGMTMAPVEQKDQANVVRIADRKDRKRQAAGAGNQSGSIARQQSGIAGRRERKAI
jgi:hypothetical protein